MYPATKLSDVTPYYYARETSAPCITGIRPKMMYNKSDYGALHQAKRWSIDIGSVSQNGYQMTNRCSFSFLIVLGSSLTRASFKKKESLGFRPVAVGSDVFKVLQDVGDRQTTPELQGSPITASSDSDRAL